MAIDKGSSHIGIAISGETMVGVHLKVSRDSFETVAAVAVETPAGAVDGTAIANPAPASVAVRRIRRELNSTAKSACVALLSPSYSMRNLRLPDVPPREQRTLARGELEESGGLPYGAGAFDMLWIPAQAADGVRHADVYAYTTSDAVVEAARTTLQQSGLAMKILE